MDSNPNISVEMESQSNQSGSIPNNQTSGHVQSEGIDSNSYSKMQQNYQQIQQSMRRNTRPMMMNYKPQLGLSQMGAMNSPMAQSPMPIPRHPVYNGGASNRFMTPGQPASNMRMMYPSGSQLQRTGSQLAPNRSMQNSNSRPMRKSSLPVINTYAPRLKKGLTAMVQKVVQEDDRRKRSKFVEPEEEEDEQDIDSDLQSYSASEDEELENKRRSNYREVGKQPVENESNDDRNEEEFKAFEMKERYRQLRATRHDYEKMNLVKLDQFSSAQEILVPIRIELDLDGYKFQDQFTWNLKGILITNI